MTSDIASPSITTIPPEPRPAEYQRLARDLRGPGAEALEPLRLAMLSSFTLDFLQPVLVVEGARLGFGIDLLLGEFGQLEQQVSGGAGDLYGEERDVLVLLFQPSDVAPGVFDRYYAGNGNELDALCTDLTERLVGAARTFRDKTGKPVLVSNLATPPDPPLGPFDAGDPGSVTHCLATHNLRLSERVHSEPDVYVWDYAGLVRQAGAGSWSDQRLRMLARVAVASRHQPALARHLLRTLTPLRRPRAKCLVLDLDNTLWGGVVGDDGLEGLQIGDDWPGSPFKDFQRAVLGLRDRGVLLAVASKNDAAVASEVFRAHPEMLIQWEDLAAVRINWERKSTSMQSIAQELNIGVDSLVLFDDNPVERAEVRAALPTARVIEVPTDPTGYRAALLGSGHFDQLGLHAEDLDRAEMYRVERARTTLREEAVSVDDFLTGLEMEAEVAEATTETQGRIAQLIGKTNQFNLTTRRHSPADLKKMSATPEMVVASLRLRDRFGEQGLIAVGILERRGRAVLVDTFLMSCRVMNRGVEQAMLVFMAERAEAMGGDHLIGEYRPTARNHIVESFFADFGFARHGESEDGVLWRLDLPATSLGWPSHIARVPVGGARKGAATP